MKRGSKKVSVLFGTIICHLVDRKLTTLKEIQQITDKGASTVYRWKKGESQPLYEDIHNLLLRLSGPAKRALLSLLTSDMPVVISWLAEKKQRPVGSAAERRDAAYETMAKSLVAMEFVLDTVRQQHQAMRQRELTTQVYVRLNDAIDCAIENLTDCKNILATLVAKRKKARVPAGM